MKRVAKIVGGVIGILCAVWGFFYHFHFFPYVGAEFERWYIPLVATSGAAAIGLITFSGLILGEGMDNR